MSLRISALLIGVATLMAWATTTPRARADESVAEAATSIVVLCAPDDRLSVRILAELESLGLSAAIVPTSTETAGARASLEGAARRAGAIAAIDTGSPERGVEVWVVDPSTGKTTLRALPNDGGTPDRDAALALRVAELLRASLVVESALPVEAPGEVHVAIDHQAKPRAPREPEPEEKPAPTLRLSLAPGVLVSPSGFGPIENINVGVDWMASEHGGLFGMASISLNHAELDSAMRLSVLLVGGGARMVFADPGSRLSPTLDVGMAATSLRTTASTTPGATAESGTSAVALALFARAGLAVALTRELRLRVDVLLGATTQAVVIGSAERPIATWGQPLLLSSVGVDFGWF